MQKLELGKLYRLGVGSDNISIWHILAVLINNHSFGSLWGGDEKMTIAISRIANETKNYKGFTISWREPDFAGAKWTANVTSEEAHRAALLRHGVQIIEGQNRDEMIAQSKEYIDSLFGCDPS